MQFEVDYKKVGRRIRELRQKHGLTQMQLGELVDCSNNHMSHIESGQTKVSLTLLLKISYALDAPLEYFLLDTPYARPEAIINTDLKDKLSRCDRTTLLTINKILDALLEQQELYEKMFDHGRPLT